MSNTKMDKGIIDKVMSNFDWSAFVTSGFVQPIIVNKDGIVLDGAHRVIAARKLGKKIPAIVLDIPVVKLDPNELTCWLDFLEPRDNDSVIAEIIVD